MEVEIALKIDSKNLSKLQEFLDNLNKTPGQQTISHDDKRVLCAKCQRDLYALYEPEEVTKIINFCNVKYKGKILCRDCQGGGSA